MQDVVMPVRVMARLGVKTLILTNAAGGVNVDFRAGTLMLISDFINMTGKNPLIGPNLDAFGPRFPDMTDAYNRTLRELTMHAARELDIDLRRGVYCWMNGPTYETPAEVRMARAMGADAVGMSTVPETIAAVHAGIKVVGISCITNMAAGVLMQPINHEEVMEMGRPADPAGKQALILHARRSMVSMNGFSGRKNGMIIGTRCRYSDNCSVPFISPSRVRAAFPSSVRRV